MRDLVDVVRPPYNGVSYNGYNRVLRRASDEVPNFRVFDWQALARTHPGWFGSDGVHPDRGRLPRPRRRARASSSSPAERLVRRLTTSDPKASS